MDLLKSEHNRPHEYVKYLSRKHEITIVSINDTGRDKQAGESRSSEFQDLLSEVDYHYLTKQRVPPYLQELLYTGKVGELSREDFDVHLNYNSLITGFRLSHHFPTIFDLADDLPAMIHSSPTIPFFLRRPGSLMGRYYLGKNLKKSQYITLTTPLLVENMPISPSKVHIIPNGVDTALFRYDNKVRDKYDSDDFIIGYVGVLREWVDLETVFQALTLLEDEVKFLVIGSQGYLKENKSLAHDYGVRDRVIFTGRLPYYQIPQYISVMDVALVPFHQDQIAYHALPMKLFEYLSCERPVISTRLGAIERELEDNILYASDSMEYVEKIRLLREDDKLRRRLGRRGREIAEKYDWKIMARKLEEILEKAANQASYHR